MCKKVRWRFPLVRGSGSAVAFGGFILPAGVSSGVGMSCTPYTTLTEEISLKRGASGLGFNIIGGTDYQPNCKDSAIYVSKIKPHGPADLDGRLKEQDQILAINGRELANVTHQEAVEIFRNSGDVVTLLVSKKVIKNNQSSKLTLSPVVMAVLGFTVLAMCIYVKYRRRL
ncbi:synaptojanin-2-binding protein [Hypanus sabinus]|uniref:synaptojanin-2-binding protein n=1 Tax=Hypanus sabinus TaxID=79690 RepID=UPI0028C4DCE5|nr:synaptojanin-2-binding protein [Hypanus sabinus]